MNTQLSKSDIFNHHKIINNSSSSLFFFFFFLLLLLLVLVLLSFLLLLLLVLLLLSFLLLLFFINSSLFFFLLLLPSSSSWSDQIAIFSFFLTLLHFSRKQTDRPTEEGVKKIKINRKAQKVIFPTRVQVWGEGNQPFTV